MRTELSLAHYDEIRLWAGHVSHDWNYSFSGSVQRAMVIVSMDYDYSMFPEKSRYLEYLNG